MNALVCRFFLRLGIAPWCAISAAVLLPLAFSVDSTLAQELKPVADRTLGAESSVVTPTSPQADRIDGGAIRGANLFHSFSQFNIGEGREAYFANPSGIENILSRVTGSDASRIFGKLGVLGNANLFLINPNGIIFGKNASLDVRGSFVGTTANALAFGDQGFFSATNPNTPALLTVNPSALLFNQIRAASIENNSVADSGLNPSSEFTATGLRVPDGKSLLLVGGDINMDGGGLFAFGGRVELGGLAGAGTVGLNGNGNNLSLSFPDSVERSNVSLSNGAGVDVTTSDGGSIAVNAGNLEMTGESYLYAGIESRLGSNNSKAGNVEVNVAGAINLNNSFINNNVQEEASGQGGDVNISARTLQVEGGAQVSASTFSAGKGGNLRIDAQDVQVIGTTADGQFASALGATVQRNSTGDAGDLTIRTNTLLVRDGAQVGSGTFGVGKSGNLSVDAQDVQVIGTTADGQHSSGLYTSAEPNSTGDAGDLTIRTNTLLVRDGAQLSASTFSAGKGGNLRIDAQDVQVIGRSADDRVGSGLYTSTVNTTGDAGDLTIRTNTLLVRDGAQVIASTFSAGKGGNLTVTANKVQVIGGSANGQVSSGLIAGTQRSTGKAGNLTITTQQLFISDGALITVSSLGKGVAGDLGINASSVRLDNSEITAQTRSGNGGNLKLNIADLLLMRRNSEISTTAGTAQQPGDGGNITINTPNGFILAVPNENSDITANAYTGIGGNVQINASGIYGTQFREKENSQTSDITASSRFGSNGTVELNTPDIDLNSALINLPSVPVDTQLAQGCNSPNYAQSSFIITGRGGLPPNPKDILTPDAVQVDWVTLNPELEKNSTTNISTNPNPTTPAPIVEATGWVFGPKGEVIFTAQAPTQHQSCWQTPSKCHEK
ncbi:hypothetical protein DP117_23520 [Brasilonema sp. UFV-L1]|nr:S-layer family protein [Brasilonema sp. UFV-L1]NMG09691.1 hypothetical protein [Brasilonema sp. UFV-L1]